MTQPDAVELQIERTVTPESRVVGVVAGLVIIAAGCAIHTMLLVVLGAPVLLGALSARAIRTSVAGGAVIQSFAAAPLRPAAVRTIPAERVRGVEVQHEHDTDAMPSRADQYWVALRLSDRRRTISLGDRHFTRGPAEAEAAALRAALGRPQPGKSIELRLPAALHERLTLLAGAGITAISTWAALDAAGGRPIEDVWPLAALALVAGMVTVGLLAAAALTAGTTGEVLPASGHVTLRRGAGWLGSRSVCLRFEEIGSVVLDGERIDGDGVVVLVLRDGSRVPITRGTDARHVAERIRQLVAADRR